MKAGYDPIAIDGPLSNGSVFSFCRGVSAYVFHVPIVSMCVVVVISVSLWDMPVL